MGRAFHDRKRYVWFSISSLAVVNGNPAISYYDWFQKNLKYVRASDAGGGSWGTPLAIDSAGDVGWHSSLAMVGGFPAIAYGDNTNDCLKYVRSGDAVGSSWGTPQIVDSGIEGHAEASLAVVSGNPAISFYTGYPEFDIKFALWSGTSWSIDTIDSEGQVGHYSSLAVMNGHPAISYCHYTNHALKFAAYY